MSHTPSDVLFSPAEGFKWRPLVERWVSGDCALAVHRQCDAFACECFCHLDPWLLGRLRYGKRKQSNRKTQKPEREKTVTRIIHRQYKEFELPPEGVHRGRLTEIKDLEPAVNAHGEEKSRVRFIWVLLNLCTSSGDRMKIYQTFNLSLDPRSFLSQTIRDVTGSDPPDTFDLDSLIDVECDLVLRHNRGDDGRTYCNVRSILRPATPAEAAEEKRVRDATAKVKEQGRRSHMVKAPEPETVEITDGDVPF